MSKRTIKKYVADFETTVDENAEAQTSTEVWATALTEVGSDWCIVENNLDTFMEQLSQLGNAEVYFHNLKFDGTFILYWLFNNPAYKEYIVDGKHENDTFPKLSGRYSYTYLVSGDGVWYWIKIKFKDSIVTIKDSLKLIPLSVKQMGEAFKTQHRKLEIDYVGERHAGGTITAKEKKYIQNDVFVVSECLDFMFSQGHTKSTIGSCCMAEYKTKFYSEDEYRAFLPDLTQHLMPSGEDVDSFIRKTYRGGFCYVNKSGVIMKNGCTADVNSLYPSVMHSESGNMYPIGSPSFFENELPDCLNERYIDGNYKYYYFVHIQANFKLKKNMLPTFQIKNNLMFNHNEWVTDDKGILCDLYFTMTDYKLFLEHYNYSNLKIIDGCYFRSYSGLFDEYINKYREIKQNSKGGMRQIAKLFLNNLYGKFATSTDSSYQLLSCTDGKWSSKLIPENEKAPVYIAIGSAITSYAREFTISRAQLNYKYFCYADTDSIHCTCSPDQLVGVKQHPTDFLAWKIESSWDFANFVRQKTYIEHNIMEDLEPCEPYYNVKCAGMTASVRAMVAKMLEDGAIELDDFKSGFEIDGNLKAFRIAGGTLLKEKTFHLR